MASRASSYDATGARASGKSRRIATVSPNFAAVSDFGLVVFDRGARQQAAIGFRMRTLRQRSSQGTRACAVPTICCYELTGNSSGADSIAPG
jgi:hypothetical protein